jgi:hypothetical protein
MTPVQRLQTLLNAANVADDEIRGGIKISELGFEKLASRLGVRVDEVKSLLRELIDSLADEHNRDMTAVYEDDSGRYAYEADFLGNLTIRDSEDASEYYFSGSDAAHIARELQQTEPGSPEEQAILQRLCSGEETLIEADADADADETEDGFIAELKNDAGSYNFPWRANGRYGTATAAYRATSKEFKLHIVSIRDARGEEVRADDALEAEVTKQARDFIGQE